MTIEYKDSKRIVKLSTDKVETVTHTEDFVSASDWLETNPTSITMDVNTTNKRIDWAGVRNSTNNAVSRDYTSIDNDAFTFRFKLTIDNWVDGNDNWGHMVYIFIGDLTSASAYNASHTGVGLRMAVGANGEQHYKNKFHCFYADGESINTGATAGGTQSLTFTQTITATSYYVEFSLLTNTSFKISLYSDSDYSTLVEAQTVTVPAGVADACRYIWIGHGGGSAGGGTTFNGEIPANLDFYNGVSSLTSKPTDVQDNSILIEKDTAKRYWASVIGNTGLKAYYKFDNASGNLINQDSSVGSSDGNGIDMANTSVTLNQTGIIDKSYLYGATSITKDASASTSWQFTYGAGASFSVVGWYKQTGATEADQCPMFDTSEGGNGLGSILRVKGINGNRYVNFKFHNGSASEQFVTANGVFPSDTNWHFLAVRATLNGGSVKITVDTSTTSFTSSNDGGDGTANEPMCLGGINASTIIGCRGELDEISFWNRILTDAEITSLYNSGSGQAVGATWTLGGFQPTDISSLAHWYDASDSSTITKDSSTNRVSQWNDKKGSDNLTESTSGDQPLWTDADQNSKAVIDFVSSRGLSNNASSVAQPNTYFVALTAPASTGTTRRPFTSGNQQVFTSASANSWGIYAGSQPAFSGDIGTSFQIWEITFNGSSSSWKINNVSKISGQNAGTGTAGSLDMGKPSDNYANNKVGEFIRYDGTLTDAQKTSVYNYLKKKWGL
jgi:hypothetical protein